MQLNNREFHMQLSAFVAIDASPLFSLLAGNVVQSYLSSTPQVQVSCPISVKIILKLSWILYVS